MKMPVTRPNTNPLIWYKENNARIPSLARLAKRYLCIQGTSVASERVFSAASSILTSNRNRLLPALVDKLIFLHNNKSLY